MHSDQETWFLLDLSSITQYRPKNPVSQILWVSVPRNPRVRSSSRIMLTVDIAKPSTNLHLYFRKYTCETLNTVLTLKGLRHYNL